MSKIGLMDKGSDQLDARSSVADTDRIPVYTSTGTEPELMTVTQLNAGGILDDDSTFTGDNTFEGTTSFDGNVTVETGNTLEITDNGGLSIASTSVSSTAAELNLLDGSVAGTVVASKAVVVDAALHQDVVHTASLNLGATGATVAVTATAAELNFSDLSAQTEAITTGAISVTKRVTTLDTTAGATLYTLAAPDASMIGQVKVISFAVDNGDATLTLTNVQGGSAATTCTWANVGEELVLVGGYSKWNVVSEGGVVLS